MARIGFTEFEEFQLNQKQRDPSLHVKPVIETALELLASGNKPDIALRVLNQIYKDYQDDRLSKISISVF